MLKIANFLEINCFRGFRWKALVLLITWILLRKSGFTEEFLLLIASSLVIFMHIIQFITSGGDDQENVDS